MNAHTMYSMNERKRKGSSNNNNNKVGGTEHKSLLNVVKDNENKFGRQRSTDNITCKQFKCILQVLFFLLLLFLFVLKPLCVVSIFHSKCCLHFKLESFFLLFILDDPNQRYLMIGNNMQSRQKTILFFYFCRCECNSLKIAIFESNLFEM